MKKHIPNLITSLNLLTGCIAIVFALSGNIFIAALLILIAMVFDFFDGFFAKLLHTKSEIGVDMDSFADIFSFAGVPAMILFIWCKECLTNLPPEFAGNLLIQLLPYTVFVVPVFSAFRLAKFNHDNRQTTSFLGLPTPANAVFLGFLPFSVEQLPFLSNIFIIVGITLIFSVLLVTEIPMFSLKLKNYKFKDNYIPYLFIITSTLLFALMLWKAFPIIILLYILISLIIFIFKKV